MVSDLSVTHSADTKMSQRVSELSTPHDHGYTASGTAYVKCLADMNHVAALVFALYCV